MSNKKASGGARARREMLRDKRQRERQRRRLTIILIVAGVALVVAAALIYPSLQPVGDIVAAPERDHPMAEGTAMGDPNAPIMVEEYSDFQCPACRVWYQTVEPEIVENYVKTGQVYLVYRHYPFLDDRVAGSESDQSANASMCAAEQNRFWDYHDLLFTNQTGENIGAFSNRRLVAFAESLGLDMEAFNACFNSNAYSNEINRDTSQAAALGLPGTPSILVNGQRLADNSLQTLQGQIEALLAADGG
jgi:protein-disulfide isomerase